MCYSAMVKRDLDALRKNYGAVSIRQDIEDYDRRSQTEPKLFPPLHSRIYPGNFAPVIIAGNGDRRVEIQRYGAYPHPSIPHPERYTSFNARRDNLTSHFWSNAYLHHHGFVVLSGFFEWVEVRDLLRAGCVTIGEIEAEFARQTNERKAKILLAGKPYKKTPTELKPALQRKIIIQFKPEDESDLLVPVIYSSSGAKDAFANGFAIITDEPPAEIKAAGHDRCPIILTADALDAWLHPEGRTARDMDELLTRRQRLTFKHQLPKAA
ncbi:MAG: SOS response-associated peptidase [Deltaproteobacteria bacterium]|nr:SOS response-associated peptidase [Deltaproteobacteria bacterium]